MAHSGLYPFQEAENERLTLEFPSLEGSDSYVILQNF